jgi:fatty acid desaturase
MEKSNIVKILPKKKPWDLQRYALTSFKFQDADKNFVVFATEDQINQAQDMLRSISNEQEVPVVKPDMLKTFALVLMVIASYAMSVWALIQTIVNPIIFIITFSIAVVCSVMLGKALSHG